MSLARARRASRIITFTSLITGAWFASVRRSEIVSSSSARRTRSLPRRSVACTSGGDSDCADRGAAGVSKAGSGFGREAAGAGAWAPISSGRGILLISGSRLSRRRRRQHAIDLRLQALQPVALALEQGVRLLVGKRDVRREEDGDLGALAGDAVALEQVPEQRQVLEEGHPALDDLFRLADQPADHHRVPGLDD